MSFLRGVNIFFFQRIPFLLDEKEKKYLKKNILNHLFPLDVFFHRGARGRMALLVRSFSWSIGGGFEEWLGHTRPDRSVGLHGGSEGR